MSKSRGQTRNRALRRGNIDPRGVSLKRPFNNRKRTKGRRPQVSAMRYFRYVKSLLKKMKEDAKKQANEKLIEEQIKKLDEGIRNT